MKQQSTLEQEEPLPRSLYFTIDPEWLTGFVRSQWAEGSYKKAIGTLNAAFPSMPIHMKLAILKGTKKLVRDKKEEHTMNVVSDKWKPDLTRCFHGHYPDPKTTLDSDIDDGEDLLDSLEPRTPAMQRYGGFDSLEEMNMAMAFKMATPTPEEFAKTMIDRDRRGKPKPDHQCRAEMAWITPDGKFYPCLTAMEHVWCAEQFGLTERQAEQLGWIKITKDFMGKRHVLKGENEPTQAQITKLFVWCERYKFPLPEWAGGKEHINARPQE